jgi:hypothetical protein
MFWWDESCVVHNYDNCSYFSVRWVVCCFKATISSDWVLDTDLELPTTEILQAPRTLSVVVLESSYIRFLSGPPDDPITIHKSWSKSGWVEGSSHISPSTGYYRSPENKKRNHHIQFNKNNKLWNKMVERTYHKVLSTIVNELLHLFLVIFTPHVRLYKQLCWARLMSKRCSL